MGMEMKTDRAKGSIILFITAGCLALTGCTGQRAAHAPVRQITMAELDAAAQMLNIAECANGAAESAEREVSPEEWGLSLIEEELIIPGMEEEYDLLFVTDTHAMSEDAADSDQVREYHRIRREQFFAKEEAGAEECLENWISFANARKVDAVLLGGDIIDCPSQGNLGYLDRQLRRLEMPYLYTPGNHDWTYPWEYMTERGTEEYLPLLQPYMEGNTALHTWENENLLVIAVDDSPGRINSGVLDEYRKLLETQKTVILLVHVPFLTQSVLEKAKETWSTAVVLGGGNYGGIYPDKVSEEFIELTTAADSPVELVLAGHVHYYDKDFIVGDKKVLQLVGDAGFHGSGILLHVLGGE